MEKMGNKYIPIKAKLNDFIDNEIIPLAKKKDLDYYQVVNLLVTRFATTEKLAIDTLGVYFKSNKLKEHRVITIPDEEIPNFLEEMKKESEEIKEDFKEVGLDGSN
jgi:hypothetical protein